jgi:hypothetical protein
MTTIVERARNTLQGAIAFPVLLAIGMLIVDAGFLAYESGAEAWSTGGESLMPNGTVSELGRTPLKDFLPKLFINPIEQPLGVWVSAAAAGALVGLRRK